MAAWLPFRRDLGLQLLALYLLFVGPVILAALVFDGLASARLRRDVQAADLALARSIALESDVALQNALATVRNLAAHPAVLSGQPEALRPLFAAVSAARGDINLVYWLDAAGTMVYHYPEGPNSTIGWDFSFRPYFRAALTAADPLMSEGRTSPTTNQPVATAVMPVRGPDGALLGVVATNLALAHLSTTLAQIAASPEAVVRVSILDAAGQVVADSDPARLLTSARLDLPLETDASLAGLSGSQIGRDPDGREWLRSYVPIPAAGWAVVVQRPTDLAFASLRAFHDGLIVAIGVFLLGGLFFWMMLSRRVLAPLERLRAFGAAISQRVVSPADRQRLAEHQERPDQVGHLIRALTQMERDIERRFTELSTLLETSTAVVSTLDSAKVLDAIVEQVQRLLGVNTCAIVALDQRAGEFRVRASRGLSAGYARRLRILPGEPRSPSMRAIRSAQPVQVSDVLTEPDYPLVLRERAELEGYRSLLAVPLITRHAPPAALLVYRPDPHVFGADEVSLLANFANHAAMAIENAALFAQTDEKLREQTRILEAIVQSFGDGLILESPDGRLLYCNRRICNLAQVSPEEAGQSAPAALRQRLLARAEVDAALPFMPGQEVSIQDAGRTLDLRLQSFDVTDEHGALLGRGHLWQDITGDKELDRLKSSLVATVSHELRTPLAAIKGNISSLLADDVEWDAAAQREFLQVALAETDRLSALVTNLLDLSRLEAGTLVMRREPCALPDLVVQAAARARAGDRLQARLEPDLPLVPADPARIEVVLRNLIENAAKYSAPGTPIVVSAARANGAVRVSVANQGASISIEHRERIFERFYRADSSRSRQTGGAGLGLAIARGLVEAHGGRLELEPDAGQTVFTFSLPLAPDA